MLTKKQEADSKKCDEMDGKGETMECAGCSCSVCLSQEEHFTIDDLVKQAHENAVKHGFWDFYDNLANGHEETKQALKSQFLMLIVGEVSEAMEGLRKGDIDNFKEELADIVIRTADLAGGLGIDLEAEIINRN